MPRTNQRTLQSACRRRYPRHPSNGGSMKSRLVPLIALSGIALLGSVPTAFADTAEVTCEVRKEGETRKGASGPCTFSQRQGYITLRLKNGDSFDLSPGDKQ